MKASKVFFLVFVVFAAFNNLFANEDDSTFTITPEDIMRVKFSVSPPYKFYFPNVIQLHLGYVNINEPYTAMSGDIYDGDVLLGNSTTTAFGYYSGKAHLGPAMSWKTSWSTYSFMDPGIIDFSSIVNGSIDGRIDFKIETGSMEINPDFISMSMLYSFGQTSGGNSIYPDPEVKSVSVVPEPFTVILLGMGGLIASLKRGRI